MPNPPGTIISAASALQITQGAASGIISGSPYASEALSDQAISALDTFDDLIRRVADGIARPVDGRARNAAVTVTAFNDAPAQVAAEMRSQGYTVVVRSNNVEVRW